jgi:plasmid maintenance system antidote protein VapI
MFKPYFGLESFSSLTFRDLQTLLIGYVVARIRNGEFSERSLARILGVSQPHLHNVLKGVRPLKPEFADTLLRQFEINVLDLMRIADIRAYLAQVEANQVEFWIEALQPAKDAAPQRYRRPPGRAARCERPPVAQCVNGYFRG